MKSAKTVLSTVLFGLTLSVAVVGFAEPKGEAPGASPPKKPGKPGAGNPGNSEDKTKPPKPDKKGPGSGAPGEQRGDRDGPRGDRDDGKGARRDPGEMGAHGHGPDGAGPPGHRRAELEKKAKAGTITDEEKSELDALRELGPHRGLHRGLHRGERIARLKELEEKEKSGALTDEEKAQLERLKKIQSRHDALKKKHDEHRSNRAKRKHEAKRKALNEFPGFGKYPDAQKEYRKHARRMAHLERARDVAQAEERTELVTRIDELIEKEKARHERWLAHHRDAKDKNQGAKGKAEETKGEQP